MTVLANKIPLKFKNKCGSLFGWSSVRSSMSPIIVWYLLIIKSLYIKINQTLNYK